MATTTAPAVRLPALDACKEDAKRNAAKAAADGDVDLAHRWLMVVSEAERIIRAA